MPTSARRELMPPPAWAEWQSTARRRPPGGWGGSTGDTVAMEITADTAVSNSATAISVTGANASANIHDNAASIHDNTAGIEVSAATATIKNNNLYGNRARSAAGPGASSTAHFNRIISGTTAIDNPNNLTPNLENNWWGCNAGPGAVAAAPSPARARISIRGWCSELRPRRTRSCCV